MGVNNVEYESGQFIRTGGGISFETRGAQPGDFTKARGFYYAAAYASNPSRFMKSFPDWQGYVENFQMRRAIITISGRQTCRSREFTGDGLLEYAKPGFLKISKFIVPADVSSSAGNFAGFTGSSGGIAPTEELVPPAGKYQLTSLSFTDRGDGYTDVNISYQQTREWLLLFLPSQREFPVNIPPVAQY